ncbi:MAG TPA: hypothetical protein VFV67_12105 [Actinophytocola sp.]|uniref:hypothetical protein n=1 Tax=Actinophytocola sp. TaxID=1872138 RepID=UPI002DB5FEDB|nr:hypothetical protein [Actinophytocola sp.]HEU5471389.1 hypothetical protein [Actinophytocola sp.]
MSAKPRWVLPVVLIAMIATVSVGIVARQLYFEPEPLPPAAVLPSESEIPDSAQPGDPTVAPVEDAAQHPLYPEVRATLQTYFDAINAKDYDRWRRAVTRRFAAEYGRDQWRDDYRSTRDGSIVVWRIETGLPGTARVLISFTSTQDPRDGTHELPDADCVRWRLVYAFLYEDDVWRLDKGLLGSTLTEAC